MAGPRSGRGSAGRAPGSLSVARLRREAAALPAHERDALLAGVLERPRSWLFAHPEAEADPRQVARFRELCRRRRAGAPLAYLLGRQAFWTLDLAVDGRVLVPRADTECLVAAALERIPEAAAVAIADLGTGSGAVALAVASARPRAQVLGVDRSRPALALARHNALRNGCRNVAWLAAHWLSALRPACFDLLACNPPYLAGDDPHLTQPELRAEPREALVAGPSGLEALAEVAAAAPGALKPGGWLLLEHGETQQEAVKELLAARGFREIDGRADLAGRPRVVAGRFAGRAS